MGTIHEQIVREQNVLWRESRELKIGAVAHLALLASGAIVVSINVLVPIIKLRGTPVCLYLLIAAWVLLLSATVFTVPYRWTVGHRASVTARYYDYLTGRPADKDKGTLESTMQKDGKRLNWWAAATWICFVAGMVILLAFVTANLR